MQLIPEICLKMHWAPIKSEPTEVVDCTEDAGAESLAAHARPIERKNKKA